jgi:3-deoxy-D-arabino-heptulosonate 7-phosphate (DAHP) synthase
MAGHILFVRSGTAFHVEHVGSEINKKNLRRAIVVYQTRRPYWRRRKNHETIITGNHHRDVVIVLSCSVLNTELNMRS